MLDTDTMTEDERMAEVANAWKTNCYLIAENERLRVELRRTRKMVEIHKKTTQEVQSSDLLPVVQSAAKLIKAAGYRVVYGV